MGFWDLLEQLLCGSYTEFANQKLGSGYLLITLVASCPNLSMEPFHV